MHLEIHLMFPAACLLSLTLAAPEQPQPRPEPKPVVGETRPAGAVARLGPNAFRHAGWAGDSVYYSPDGKRVGATTYCGIYLWDAATGKRLLWVPADEQTVTQFLGFHSSGDVIVSCRRKLDDNGAGVFRIDPATGKINATFQPKEDRSFYTVTPDGKVVFSRTRENEFVAENIANEIYTGKEVWRRKMPMKSWMRISPVGSRLVVRSSLAKWDPEVVDTATGKTVERFIHPDNESHPTWMGSS